MSLAPTVAVLIGMGYAAALWWWLRHESRRVLLGLVALCTAALALRLVYTTEYPPGLTGDEPKILVCSTALLRSGQLAAEGCTGLPVLLNALFQAQLVPLFGPGRWAIRSYSLVTSVLAVPAAFAVARALALDVASSFGVGIFVSVLPWAIFFGRVAIGGELIFHELLLVGALARLVWSTGVAWPELGIGGLGLCLLLYDYFCGRAMLGLPFAAALLARGRRRWLCVGVLLVAVIAWAPYLRSNPPNGLSGTLARLHPALLTQPLQTMSAKLVAALHALTAPVGEDWTLTIRAGAMHPPLVLVLAFAGVIAARWRGLFLAVGFASGLLPAIVSSGTSASAHRMLMALPFIALAAGAGLDALPRRRWHTPTVCAVVLLISVQSIGLFFSAVFWPPESRATFDPDATALIESIPLPPRPPLIYAWQAVDFLAVQWVIDPTTLHPLTAQNWLPERGAAIYAFADPDTAALRPFYEHLFGSERVRSFGRAFRVDLEARDWSGLRQHGWAYEVDCGTSVRQMWVPTLYHAHLPAGGPSCPEQATNIWRGRWEGPPAHLVLRFSGVAQVQTSSGISANREGLDTRLPFSVTPGTDVTITVVAPPLAGPNTWEQALLAELSELTPAGERIPLWESVRPNMEPVAAAAAVP